jgi:ribosome maturation factor RimP
MTETELKATITRLATPLAESLGLIVWGIEIVHTNRPLLRLFVDVPPGCDNAQTGVAPGEEEKEEDRARSATLEQCAEISRHLGLALDVENSIPKAYVLEVSTPGLTRTFFDLQQMLPYLGDMVEARLLTEIADEGNSVAPRRLWRGLLQAVEEKSFVLAPAMISAEGTVEVENLPQIHIPWDAVRRASRMYVFKKPQKPGKKPKKHNKKSGKRTQPRKK